MSVEHRQEQPQPVTNPQELLALKEAISTAWKQLPPEHQATMVLALLDTVRQGEWGTWVENALTLPRPSERDPVTTSFPVVTISRADLWHKGFSGKELTQLSDHDMQKIAERLGSHVEYSVLLDDFAFFARKTLAENSKESPATAQVSGNAPPYEAEQKLTFDDWMGEVNKAVYGMVACSVDDLPDCDFWTMYEDGVTPMEAADEALLNAGFSRFE